MTLQLVSVIVPTRNPSGLLLEAVESVYAQVELGTRFRIEVVVVDDGSGHPEPERRALLRRYPGLVFIGLPEQRGQSAARNVGIKASSGDYIAFLDDDDVWLPGKLAQQVPVLERRPSAGVVFSPIIIRFEDRDWVFPAARQAPSGWVLRALCRDLFIGNPLSVLVRRGVLERAGFFDETLPVLVDYDLWLRLALQAPFSFLPGVVAIYRRSTGGTFFSRSRRGAGEHALRQIFANIASWLPQRQEFARLRRELPGWLAMHLARHQGILGDLDRMRAQVLEALACHPWLAGDAATRRSIAEMVRKLAFASPSPVAVARRFEEDVRRATSGAGFRHRRAVRRVVGEVWAELAVGLAYHRRPPARDDAARAAVAAIIHDATKLMRRTLPWIIGQMPLRFPRIAGGAPETPA